MKLQIGTHRGRVAGKIKSARRCKSHRHGLRCDLAEGHLGAHQTSHDVGYAARGPKEIAFLMWPPAPAKTVQANDGM